MHVTELTCIMGDVVHGKHTYASLGNYRFYNCELFAMHLTNLVTIIIYCRIIINLLRQWLVSDRHTVLSSGG